MSSKPVRIPDRLYDRVEELARAESRSVANMVKVLLERALSGRPGEQLAVEQSAPDVDDHFQR